MAAAGDRRRHRGGAQGREVTASSRPAPRSGACVTVEWGWIVAAILFGWISTRAEQATTENIDTERSDPYDRPGSGTLGRWRGHGDPAGAGGNA